MSEHNLAYKKISRSAEVHCFIKFWNALMEIHLLSTKQVIDFCLFVLNLKILKIIQLKMKWIKILIGGKKTELEINN